ncbi:MAG: FKBP-type peptidyl-prolyl cis-trans isomerase [Candidatus Paceibacterota bacterium]|jgi:peptidylprolyl isomerase/FKBP-type peptidyl-prolyl cis-trans isomerase FkpA
MRNLGLKGWIAVAVAIAAAAFMFFGNSLTNFFFPAQKATDAAISANQPTDVKNTSAVAGLEVYDNVVGTGAEAVAGKTVTAHYVGMLVNGTKFDSSVDRGQPFSFALGAGQVIRGWDLGIQGMKVGGKRRLVISPELGYGAQAVGGVIPANSTLVFDVELLGVK